MNKQSQIYEDASSDYGSGPDYLYKHFKFYDNIEWTKKIFTHQEIYFPSPNQFNDPYDSRVRHIFEGSRSQKKLYLRKQILSIDPSLSSKELHEKVNQAMKNIDSLEDFLDMRSFYNHRREMGIFCMTQKRDNILMWSHYSNKHQGFSLEFSTKNEFFARALPISYVDEVPKFNLLGNQSIQEIAETFLKKAKDWEYEAEWRISDIQWGPGKKQFPPEALTGIILGARIPEEDKKNILKWCSYLHASPKIYEAKMDNEKFRLNIHEIE
jgi:hypothetical protein